MAEIHTNLDPLPREIRDGMIAMGVFGLMSSASTLSLMLFITYRMVFWRRYYDHPIATNQIFVLIYNLLLADFQQALSFVFSFYWISKDKLVGPSPACFAQGWLIQIGDVSSGLWVLAIAVHTFINLVGQRTIKQRTFVIAVVALWIFCLFLTAIGPLLSKDDFFIPAGAWCWMNETHENERLYLHYLWIFISQLGSLVIYISVFFFLRGRLANSSKLQNAALILRTARYMVVYPFAYVFLTLPLAAGRVSSMAGKRPPLVFFPVAGTLMASCGIIDVVLYLTTRKALVRSSVGAKGSGNGLTRFRTNESARREARGQSFRLGEIRDEEEEDRLPVGNGAPLGGTIVVSKSIVMSADSFQESGRSHRSDSLQSLVINKEEFPHNPWLK
ncbi:G protein-coupled glucose receptor regulating Gpa2-domain-containing protein [Leptodontidium sp. 2 PMI_412]|nr:G protein-coupled glucose receptor regulating Gpa2-domain-containing protein [Leptodontidium sp. 2 PMI_412]